MYTEYYIVVAGGLPEGFVNSCVRCLAMALSCDGLLTSGCCEFSSFCFFSSSLSCTIRCSSMLKSTDSRSTHIFCFFHTQLAYSAGTHTKNKMVFVLTYFNLRARGELARLICEEGKLNYKNNIVSNWSELKPKVKKDITILIYFKDTLWTIANS